MPSEPSAPSRSTEAPLTHRAADTALASATGTAAAAPMPQSPSPAANSTQRHRMPAPIGCRWKPRPRNCTHPPKRRREGARQHDRRHGTGAAAVAALGCAALAGAAMTAAIRARAGESARRCCWRPRTQAGFEGTSAARLSPVSRPERASDSSLCLSPSPRVPLSRAPYASHQIRGCAFRPNFD